MESCVAASVVTAILPPKRALSSASTRSRCRFVASRAPQWKGAAALGRPNIARAAVGPDSVLRPRAARPTDRALDDFAVTEDAYEVAAMPGEGGVPFPIIRRDVGRRVRPAAVGCSLHQPRLSLLGKPLSYRSRQRDLRYRKAQSALHKLLERPRGCGPISYHLSL